MIEDPQKVRETLAKSLEQYPDEAITLLPEIRSEFPELAVSNIVETHEVSSLYFPLGAEQSVDSPNMHFGQQLLDNIPCNIFIYDPRKADITTNKRMLVPLNLTDSKYLIQYLIEHGSPIDQVVPLHITPDFGSDSRNIAKREMDMLMEEIGSPKETLKMTPYVVLADDFHEGIMYAVRSDDIIVLGGASIKLLYELRREILRIRPAISETIIIGIFRPSSLASKTKFGRFVKRLKIAIPELTMADRISLFDRIQGGSRLSPDFIAMMALSVMIASLGLLSDNSSVVIGAMLVAPFMTPLIGVGLAQAQGNLALMKRSGLATGSGLVVGFVLSFILGVLVPLDELPLEILSRGDPNIVDLGIAFVSGMAAAYAVSRESVAEAIVGVAIAAALVPPLCCLGISCSQGYFPEARGASLLLLTNLAAISLGAAFVFRILGVPGTRNIYQSYSLVRRVSIILISMIFVLTIPLGFQMEKQLKIGQTRPMRFRTSNKLNKAIYEYVNSVEGLEVMFLGRSGSGRSKSIQLLLSSDNPVSDLVVDQIERIIHGIMGKDTPARIKVFQNAVIPEEEP